MCLEDLRLGRGRYPIKPRTVSNQAVLTELLLADPRRVAIAFAAMLNGITTNVAGDTVSDKIQLFAQTGSVTIPFAVLTMYNPNLLMRIEDYGQLVTSQIFQLAEVRSTELSIVFATPIVTDVVAPIMDGSHKH